MNLVSKTLTDAIKELKTNGYEHEFQPAGETLLDVTRGIEVSAGAVHIDGAYCFESTPDSGDASNLFALSLVGGTIKGLLIDPFNLMGDKGEQPIHNCLQKHLQSAKLIRSCDQPEPSQTKYGLPKVFKTDFDADPTRFVLRKGYPDFPPCPFGQRFSMLGYDRVEKCYVWLVTSIFRDQRLVTETYEK